MSHSPPTTASWKADFPANIHTHKSLRKPRPLLMAVRCQKLLLHRMLVVILTFQLTFLTCITWRGSQKSMVMSRAAPTSLLWLPSFPSCPRSSPLLLTICLINPSKCLHTGLWGKHCNTLVAAVVMCEITLVEILLPSEDFSRNCFSLQIYRSSLTNERVETALCWVRHKNHFGSPPGGLETWYFLLDASLHASEFQALVLRLNLTKDKLISEM